MRCPPSSVPVSGWGLPGALLPAGAAQPCQQASSPGPCPTRVLAAREAHGQTSTCACVGGALSEDASASGWVPLM